MERLLGMIPAAKIGPMPSFDEERRLERAHWFVRSAQRHGWTLSPKAKHGKVHVMTTYLAPEAFLSNQQAGYWAKRMPMDVLRARWGDEIIEATIRLPEKPWAIPVIVHAATEEAAKKRLRAALPKGTEIEFDG